MTDKQILARKKFRLTRFIALIACTCFTSLIPMNHVMALDIFTKALVGIDTNPHDLSDVHLPIQQEYWYADFNLSANYAEMFFVEGYGKQANYLNDERANWFKSEIALAFKSNFKIKEYEFHYEISADQLENDETYVSKTTGLVATLNNQSLADRYDFTSTHAQGLLSYKTEQNATFKLRYQTRDKSYEELNIVELSNIDYSHTNIGLDIDYFVSEKGKIFAETSFITRNYLDKRAKDLDGLDVIDSNLVYDILDVKVGYLYQPENGVRWKYTFKYTSRTDNDSGYWNADSGYISISTKYDLTDYHLLSANLKYSKFSYENPVDYELVALDEQDKEKLGFSLELDYQWILATLYKTKLGLYASVRLDAFTSNNELYEYQRKDALVGIRWSL